MPDVYAALAHPTRRRILDIVRDDERSVNEIVSACGLTQPGTSKQLRVLHEAGLVSVRVDGPRRLYSLRSDPLKEVDAWLSRYRKKWAARLDALERVLDEETSRRHRSR